MNDKQELKIAGKRQWCERDRDIDEVKERKRENLKMHFTLLNDHLLANSTNLRNVFEYFSFGPRSPPLPLSLSFSVSLSQSRSFIAFLYQVLIESVAMYVPITKPTEIYKTFFTRFYDGLRLTFSFAKSSFAKCRTSLYVYGNIYAVTIESSAKCRKTFDLGIFLRYLPLSPTKEKYT